MHLPSIKTELWCNHITQKVVLMIKETFCEVWSKVADASFPFELPFAPPARALAILILCHGLCAPQDFKYVFLGANSTFKADSDQAKYEKVRLVWGEMCVSGGGCRDEGESSTAQHSHCAVPDIALMPVHLCCSVISLPSLIAMAVVHVNTHPGCCGHVPTCAVPNGSRQ